MTTTADLQERTCLQLGRRAGAMQRDIGAWTAPARTEAMGLTGPQRIALVNMLGDLAVRQQAALDALDKTLPPGEFADKQAEALLEVTGAQEVWRVFRTILGQLEDRGVGDTVRAASRVAVDCYATGIVRARELEAVPPERLRESPLVYLEATDSPATAGRGDRTQALSASIRQWRNLTLPLPIVLLPSDYIDSMWSYCALHHEVGHNLDQDLDLLAQLRAALPDTVIPQNEPHWRRWSREIVADALGIVLGGAGFALSLGTMALTLGPAARFSELDVDAVHPPLLIRAKLLVEMLRRSGVAAHGAYADDLEAAWTALPKPAWMDAFTAEAAKVASLYLETKLAILKDRALTELNPKASAEHAMVEALAEFLDSGRARPDPASAAMSPKLVPLAAQVAVFRKNPLDAEALRRIHEAAVAYLGLIPHRVNLAGPLASAAARREYLRGLTRRIDFRKLGSED
jgi:hypothetical protein